MKKAARRGDLCTGHDDCSPRPARRGSADVTVNDRAVLRVSDPFVPHGCPDHRPHPGKVKKGSSTVTINDLPAARIGDPIDCGSDIQTGSADVYIGD
jgi:uncharacterized Zn-binding protein involved in type VI secretion